MIGKYSIVNYILSKFEYIGYNYADLIVGSMKNLGAHLKLQLIIVLKINFYIC